MYGGNRRALQKNRKNIYPQKHKVVHELIHPAKKFSSTVAGGISLALIGFCQYPANLKLAQIFLQLGN